MVIAEMAELGAFTNSDGTNELIHERKKPFSINGSIGKEGIGIGTSVLLEPQIKIKNPIADNPKLEKQKLKKFKRLVLVEFRMLFAEQFFLHFPHAVPGEFGNRQDPFGKFERCELRAQMLQDEFFTESIMI